MAREPLFIVTMSSREDFDGVFAVEDVDDQRANWIMLRARFKPGLRGTFLRAPDGTTLRGLIDALDSLEEHERSKFFDMCAEL